MSEPFLGQLSIFSFNFAPKGWALCNGQLLPINQNQALFSLLGTMYGGNGTVNFALPDMRSRIPIGVSGSHSQGERAGQETHTLTIPEMPAHMHALMADGSASPPATNTPSSTTFFAKGTGVPAQGSSFAIDIYSTGNPGNSMAPQMIAATGGSQAHENRMPISTLNFCIALQGIFPSRN